MSQRLLSVFLLLAMTLSGVESTASSELIPSLEDAGYAYEATENCTSMSTSFGATRMLKRKPAFKDGRRTFRNAVGQWGKEWACKTAFEQLGPEIDLSEYLLGQLVVQPPASEIPPLPVFKSEYPQDRTTAATE